MVEFIFQEFATRRMEDARSTFGLFHREVVQVVAFLVGVLQSVIMVVIHVSG